MARAIASRSRCRSTPVLVENRPGAGGNLAADRSRKRPRTATRCWSASPATPSTRRFIRSCRSTRSPISPPISKIRPCRACWSAIPSSRRKISGADRARQGQARHADASRSADRLVAPSRRRPVQDDGGRPHSQRALQGTAPALTDVLGGQIDMMFISLVTGTAQCAPATCGLSASPARSASRRFPICRPIGEIVKGFELTAWFGVFGPANLPAITDKLNAAIVAALNDPGCASSSRNGGAAPAGGPSAADFAAFVRDDVQRWAPIVTVGGAARLRAVYHRLGFRRPATLRSMPATQLLNGGLDLAQPTLA